MNVKLPLVSLFQKRYLQQIELVERETAERFRPMSQLIIQNTHPHGGTKRGWAGSNRLAGQIEIVYAQTPPQDESRLLGSDVKTGRIERILQFVSPCRLNFSYEKPGWTLKNLPLPQNETEGLKGEELLSVIHHILVTTSLECYNVFDSSYLIFEFLSEVSPCR